MAHTLSDKYTLQSLSVEENCVRARFFLPKDLLYFDGHFDEAPILPGVVQVHWAIDLARAHLNIPGHFSAIDSLKFMRIIPPEATLDLQVMYDRHKGLVGFSYMSGITTHSTGSVRFA